MNVEKAPSAVAPKVAPVGLWSTPTPSEARSVPVADHSLDKDKQPNTDKPTPKTWGQLKTEIQALSDVLDGFRAVRASQEDYLQRLVSG